MPKAELHLHLEGTIAPDTLWAMAGRNGVKLAAESLEELRRLYVFEDFSNWRGAAATLAGVQAGARPGAA